MKRKPKYHHRIVKGKPVSLSPSPWDMGATGPANRHGLEVEPATELTPDGETPNPNGIARMRRKTSAEVAQSCGALEKQHVISAHELRAMSEGGVYGGGDPLAAISIKSPSSGVTDPLAVRFDARRRFHQNWNRIPQICRQAVESLVIEDKDEIDAFGGKLCDIIDGYAKIRVGLQAVFEGEK